MRRHAMFISASVILPSFRDFLSVVKKDSPTISISMPALRARAATVCLSPKPCGTNSSIAVKSVTTNPLKPHCLRSRSVISHRLAVAGTPLISLNELIALPEPASNAAL